MKQASKRKRIGGFSLIELMVAMVITALIVTILISITGVATDTWTRSRAELRASRQAKTFIDTLAKDLESMVSRRGNNFEWLHAEVDSNADLPTVVRDNAGSGDAVSLTFITAATDRYFGQIGAPSDKGGDASCAAYRLRHQNPISDGADEQTDTFVVYRSLVNPNVTFQDLLGQPNLKVAFQPFEDEVEDKANFICENVHQFEMTFLVEVTETVEEGGIEKIVRRTVRVPLLSEGSGKDFRLKGNGIETNAAPNGVDADVLAAGRLRGVELSVSVLSDAGVSRMNAADGLTPDDYARNVFHYSRVVEVPSQ